MLIINSILKGLQRAYWLVRFDQILIKNLAKIKDIEIPNLSTYC